MARTRAYEFIVGPETSTLPESGTPTETDDVVTLGYAQKHFKQGALAVADVTALKAIVAADRTDKDEVFVESLRRNYHFDSGSSATGDDIYVITPSAGTGRWLCLDPNPIMETALLGKAISTPANPAASHRKLYAKTDGWYDLDSSGNEVLITPVASDGPVDLRNLGIAASVGSSALTFNLTDKAGSTPSAGSPVRVPFRNATSATGTYTIVSVTGSLGLTIPSTATMGHSSGQNEWIYQYLLNNAGAAEYAVSTSIYETGSIVSTTVLDTASDSRTAIYSTTARSNVPLVLIGRAKSNQVTAGTWAAVPTELTPGNTFQKPFARHSAVYYGNGNGGTGRGSGSTQVKYFASGSQVGTAINPGGDSTNGTFFTIQEAGLYQMHWSDRNSSAVTMYITKNVAGVGTDSSNSLAKADCPATAYQSFGATEWLIPGDVIRCCSDAAGNFVSSDTARFAITKIG